MGLFVVGSEVVEMRGGFYGKITKVAKVHKNGNFTLVGDSQQFRQWVNNPRAQATGSSYRNVELVTDENRELIAKHHAFGRARHTIKAEIDRLTELMGVTYANPKRDEVIAAAAKIEGSK